MAEVKSRKGQPSPNKGKLKPIYIVFEAGEVDAQTGKVKLNILLLTRKSDKALELLDTNKTAQYQRVMLQDKESA